MISIGILSMIDIQPNDLKHENDASDFLKLSILEYGEDADVSSFTYFKNKYLANPSGTARSLNLSESGENIGRLVLLHRVLLLGSKVIDSVYPTEFLIQKEHRGIDKLMKLMKSFKSHKEAVKFTFVTPNKNSLNIWRKLSGFENELTLKVKVIPLRPLKLLFGQYNSRIRDLFCCPVDLFVKWLFFFFSWVCDQLSFYSCKSVSIDDLYTINSTEFFHDNELRGDRSQRNLSWRTSFRPSNDYEFVQITKNQDVVGYGIFSLPLNYDGLKPVVLLDVVAKPEHRLAVFKSLGRYGVLRNKQSDLVLFLGVVPFLNSTLLQTLPLIGVPDRFIPDANSLLFQTGSDELNNADIYMTLFDFDMF